MDIIDGKKLAEQIKDEIAQDIFALGEKRPSLAIILVGDRPDSQLYVRLKEKQAKNVGIDTHLYRCSENITEEELLETIDLPTGTYWDYGYGMVYSNSKYWISSSSSSAGSGIIKAVDNTGAEVDQIIINYPTMKASQGLAFDGTNFWYVERKTARCDLFKVSPDGTVLDSIPTSTIGGSYYLGGAAWDGTGLWISRSEEHTSELQSH